MINCAALYKVEFEDFKTGLVVGSIRDDINIVSNVVSCIGNHMHSSRPFFEATSFVISRNYKLHISYVSELEKKLYEAILNFSEFRLNNIKGDSDDYSLILVTAPYGNLVVISHTPDESFVLYKSKIPLKKGNSIITNDSLTNEIYSIYEFDNVDRNIIQENEFDSYFNKFFCKYNYRYKIYIDTQEFANNGKIEVLPNAIISISNKLIDGTHYKADFHQLLKYHLAAIPCVIDIEIKNQKSSYCVHMMLYKENIRLFFEKFYGLHKDSQVDFNIIINTEKKEVNLEMYRYGLTAPIEVPSSCYQLIAYKSGFEYYRTENYNTEYFDKHFKI